MIQTEQRQLWVQQHQINQVNQQMIQPQQVRYPMHPMMPPPPQHPAFAILPKPPSDIKLGADYTPGLEDDPNGVPNLLKYDTAEPGKAIAIGEHDSMMTQSVISESDQKNVQFMFNIAQQPQFDQQLHEIPGNEMRNNHFE